jgi:hypothetical protein
MTSESLKGRMGRVGLFMQPGQMEEVVAHHADADAIVLFIGLAGPDDFKGASGGNGKPKLILVSNFESSDQARLRKGIIQLAIVPRPGADTDEDKTILLPIWRPKGAGAEGAPMASLRP